MFKHFPTRLQNNIRTLSTKPFPWNNTNNDNLWSLKEKFKTSSSTSSTTTTTIDYDHLTWQAHINMKDNHKLEEDLNRMLKFAESVQSATLGGEQEQEEQERKCPTLSVEEMQSIGDHFDSEEKVVENAVNKTKDNLFVVPLLLKDAGAAN